MTHHNKAVKSITFILEKTFLLFPVATSFLFLHTVLIWIIIIILLLLLFSLAFFRLGWTNISTETGKKKKKAVEKKKLVVIRNIRKLSF